MRRLKLVHTGQGETLRLIKKHPSGLCDSCATEESVEHSVILGFCKYSGEKGKRGVYSLSD